MIIKKKSIIVAAVSGMLVSIVLTATVAAYLLHVEINTRNFRGHYEEAIKKLSAKAYAKQIDFFRLRAVIGTEGAFRLKPIVEGVMLNNGNRAVRDIVLKIKFRDTDGAVIYEVVFHPQEPALGMSILGQVPIPYLSEPHRISVDPGERLVFKRLLSGCPREIASAIKEGAGQKTAGYSGWAGTLEPEILSIEF